MPASRRGLNALIEQCRRLEAELDGAGSRESTAMHRFVAEMDAHRAPPGMWSPLALAVLTMAGGVGVGLLSLLLPLVGAAAAALVLACAATALVLAIGVVAFMGGHAYGLVLLRRLALGLAAAGALGLIAWTQGDMRAVGPALARTGRLAGAGQQCLLCLRRLPDGAAGDGPARGPPALTAPAVPGAAVPGGVGPALGQLHRLAPALHAGARTIPARLAGRSLGLPLRGELVLAGPEAHGKAGRPRPARSIPIRAGAPRARPAGRPASA